MKLASDPIFTSLPLFASFLKSFGRLYLGPEPKEEEGEAAEGDELILGAVQDRLRTYFMNYYEALAKNVQKGRVVSFSFLSLSLSLSLTELFFLQHSAFLFIQIEVARARFEEPRGVHQVWGDF